MTQQISSEMEMDDSSRSVLLVELNCQKVELKHMLPDIS